MAAANGEFWNQKTFCLVTGASRGIGADIAKEFSKNVGPDSVILIVARSTPGLLETKSQMISKNSQVVISEQDLGNPTSAKFSQMINSALSSTGTKAEDFQHYILVHNAGSLGNITLKVTETDSLQELQEYYTFNLISLILLNTEFFKIFSDSTKQRSVIQISSLGAVEPLKNWGPYCAGKAARDMLMKSIALEDPSISTLNWVPGPVDTEIYNQDMAQTGDPELAKQFDESRKTGQILTCEQTISKLVRVLAEKKFTKGERVDSRDVQKISSAVVGPLVMEVMVSDPENLCPRPTTKSGERRANAHTTGEKPHLCQTCGRGFNDKKNLYIHTRTHTGVKPYSCGVCGKPFSDQSNLRRHSLTHTDEKPFECKTCGKKVTGQQSLTHHMRIHTREKPFGCDKCGKCFSVKTVFNKHVCKEKKSKKSKSRSRTHVTASTLVKQQQQHPSPVLTATTATATPVVITQPIVLVKKLSSTNVVKNLVVSDKEVQFVSKEKESEKTVVLTKVPTPQSSPPVIVLSTSAPSMSTSKPTLGPKLKRTNSKAEVVGEVENFLTFHVLTPGSNKSTEVVPAKKKQKVTESILVNRQQPSTATSSRTATPATSTNLVVIKQPAVLDKNLSKNLVPSVRKVQGVSKGVDKKSRRPSDLSISSQSQDHRARSTSSSNSKTTPDTAKKESMVFSKTPERSEKNSSKYEKSSSRNEKEKRKESPKISPEDTLRENMKNSIRKILQNRMNSSHGELNEETNRKSPEEMARQIESELVQCFGSWNNTKCKTKYRSIFFNLKDPSSALYCKLLNGTLLAKDLVRMEPQQMSSAELTRGIPRESGKELDSIKIPQIDGLTEAKKQVNEADEAIDKSLTELHRKGSVEEEKRSMAIQEVNSHKGENEVVVSVVTTPTSKVKVQSSTSNSSSSRAHSHGHSYKDKKCGKERKHDKNKDKDRHRHKSSSENDKKLKRKDSKKNLKKVIEDKDEEAKGNGETMSGKDRSTPEQPAIYTKTKHLVAVEENIASSVSSSHTSAIHPALMTTLFKSEFGEFNAVLFNVSHSHVDGVFFPEAPVPIIGRVPPEHVWKYLVKTENKEFIIFRLAPASSSDTEVYMSLISSLSIRKRFGILGGMQASVRNVYLVPLHKDSEVNENLLPYMRGRGLPKDRSDCLLAVVVRNEMHGAPVKRLKVGPPGEP